MRIHFCESTTSERTVCGVSLANGGHERLPLVFWDLKLWAYMERVGRCYNCAAAVTKRAPAAAAGSRNA